MTTGKNIPENEVSWLDDELASPITTNPSEPSHNRSVNTLLIVLMKMKTLMGRPVLFFLVLCFSGLSNLWLYTVDRLGMAGMATDSFVLWVCVLIQPWIFLGQWVTQRLSLPSPYTSIQTSLITGIVSAILLSICLQLVIRRFPRLLRASVILLFLLTVGTGVSYVLDSYRLHVYLSTPHDCGP